MVELGTDMQVHAHVCMYVDMYVRKYLAMDTWRAISSLLACAKITFFNNNYCYKYVV